MLYVIKNVNGKYFNSGTSRYVSSAGHCDTPSWGDLDEAWGTTSKELAESVAKQCNGTVVEKNTGSKLTSAALKLYD